MTSPWKDGQQAEEKASNEQGAAVVALHEEIIEVILRHAGGMHDDASFGTVMTALDGVFARIAYAYARGDEAVASKMAAHHVKNVLKRINPDADILVHEVEMTNEPTFL